MDRLVTLFIAMAVAFAAGVGWEHRPAIGWHAKVLFWNVGFQLPDGLATQLEQERAQNRTAKASLEVCKVNADGFEARLREQNKAILAVAKDGDERAKRLERALEGAAAEILESRRRAAAMDFTPAGDTRCERYDDVDRRVLEALR